LETSFDHMQGHYVALLDEETRELQAALPVFDVRSWPTGNRLVSIPFATLSDPLISSGAELTDLRIARANKCNLRLKVGSNESDSPLVSCSLCENKEATRAPPQPCRFFEAIWANFHADGKAQLLLAESEGKVIAGLMLFKWKDRVSAETAASDERFLNMSPIISSLGGNQGGCGRRLPVIRFWTHFPSQ